MLSGDFKVDVHGKFGVTPIKAEEGSVGYDIALPEDEGPLIMPYNSRRDIDTGVIIRPPDKCFEVIVPRSNSYKRNLRISNTLGVIDPSYCGKDDTIIVSLTREPRKRVYLGQVTTEGLTSTEYNRELVKYCREELGRNVKAQIGTETNALSFGQKRDCLAILDCTTDPEEWGTWHLYGYEDPTYRVYEPGARFCQVLFIPFFRPDLVKKTIEEFNPENRGGFGSTGGV